MVDMKDNYREFRKISFTCPYCNNTLMDQDTLDKHVRKQHSAEFVAARDKMGLPCFQCESHKKVYLNKKYFDDHMDKYHPTQPAVTTPATTKKYIPDK